VGRIWIVDGDRNACSAASMKLRQEGHEVWIASSSAEALGAAGDVGVDLLLCDARPEGLSALEILAAWREESPGTAVVVSSAGGSVEEAVQFMQAGAHNYLCKPFDLEELGAVVDKALAPSRSAPVAAPEPVTRLSRARLSPSEVGEACGIIGRAPAIREAVELLAKVAETDSTVLVTGETGTGKELFGRALHRLSPRRERVFCAVNSAAFPETLLESELFGHRRGAFTGAAANKKGLFEQTHQGTVFLDEVAEMPLSMQAKLLRFLQTGEIRPVGGESTRFVDVRLVTATNKDLEREVAAGRFREDLYYRLAVIPVHVPPLRERIEDIPLLVDHFLARFARRLGQEPPRVDAGALELLASYAWPGNVRQLENTLERAVALCRGGRIGAEDLPERLRERPAAAPSDAMQSLPAVERAHILNTLDRVGWNRKRAAEILQISTTTLWRRLKEFGIETDGNRRPVHHFSGPQG